MPFGRPGKHSIEKAKDVIWPDVSEEQVAGEEIYKKIGQAILDRKSKEENILKELQAQGIDNAVVETILSPPWTTDWMTEEGKEKLRKEQC